MAGTIFLSCGQNDRELAIAERIALLLQGQPFGLSVFIARSTNNLLSLNNDVLTKLAYADYVLFVNFRREAAFSGSLYSHQELAMALAIGHRQLLIFSEAGAPNTGVIQFVVQNRPPFDTPDELLAQIRTDVTREQWTPHYSRFLRAISLETRTDISFGDGAGNVLTGTAISVVIQNGSKELQESVIVALEQMDGNEPGYLFRSPLKVSGQRRYDAAIPPESSVIFNIVIDGTRAGPERSSGAFLISSLDLTPLSPLIADDEDHEMQFRVDARARQPIRFTITRQNGEYTLT